MAAVTQEWRVDAPGEAALADPALHPKIPLRDKIAYGVGSCGEGVAVSATGSLLLFFYSQVFGLSAGLVGTGLLATGLGNAALDMFIGRWSDESQHRWGRRHFFLYVAPVPGAVSLVLLFAPPPSLGPWALFAWMIFWYSAMRACVSLYTIPFWSLGAELSNDYHERTTIASSRIFFSFLGAGGFFFISLFFFNTRDGASGALLRAPPYFYLALAVAAFTMLLQFCTAFGTRHYVPFLRKQSHAPSVGGSSMFWRELRSLFKNRAFVVFFAGAGTLAIAVSTKSLDVYLGLYFWRLPTSLTLILPGLSILAFAAGTFFWREVAKHIGKKHAYIAGVVGYGAIMSILPVMKVAGWFFAEDSTLYFPAILAISMIANVSSATVGVMAGAILPDVVDDYFHQSGRRVTGLITGLMLVVATIAAAASQLSAGLILSLVGLQPRALPASVPRSVSDNLGLVSALLTAVVTVAFFLIFRLYPISGRRRIVRDSVELQT